MIKDAIEGYSEICGKEIALTIRRNKIEKDITLCFLERNFFHLAGLQYLTDIHNSFPKSRVNSYELLRVDPVLRNIVRKSTHYNKENTQNRMQICKDIKSILEDKFEVYLFNKDDIENNGEKIIQADYIIKLNHKGNRRYLFFEKDSGEKYYIGKSAFETNARYHHTKNQCGVRKVVFPKDW